MITPVPQGTGVKYIFVPRMLREVGRKSRADLAAVMMERVQYVTGKPGRRTRDETEPEDRSAETEPDTKQVR